MSADQVLPDAVRDVSPTATAVYVTLLQADEPLAYDDLEAELGASRRALEQAIGALRKRDLVRSRPDVAIPCRHLHEPTAVADPSE